MVGAFGGITQHAIEALSGKNPECFSTEYYSSNADYQELVEHYNQKHPDNKIDYQNYFSFLKGIGLKGITEHNGLTEENNLRLTTTPHISEIVCLILKGLSTCFIK